MEHGSLQGCDWRAGDNWWAFQPASFPSPGISHTGPQLEKCHCCTLTYIWRNELHYLFTHSSSSLVFQRLGGSWIPFCTKGFSELLGLAVSSQCLPGVITWWHLKHSAAVLGSAGLWRLQQWLSWHRDGFSTTRFVHSAREKLFTESDAVWSPVSRIRLLLVTTGIKSSHLTEAGFGRGEQWCFLLCFDVSA